MMLVVDQIDAKRAYPENLSGDCSTVRWECGRRQRLERKNEEQEEIGR